MKGKRKRKKRLRKKSRVKWKQMIIRNDILIIYENFWSIFFLKETLSSASLKKKFKCFSKFLKVFFKYSQIPIFFYLKNVFKCF